MKKFAKLMLLTVLLAMLVPAGAALAETSGTNGDLIYRTPIASADISLNGSSSRQQQFFQILSYWKVTGVQVSLDYLASPLTQNNRSSVTVLVNGTAVTSFRPVADGQKRQHLVIDVPGSVLVRGANTLTVEGNLTTGDDLQICTPNNESENWLELFKTSAVTVRYVALPLTGTIGDFNARFTGPDAISGEEGAIVVPKDAEASELEAAVYALSGFAQTAGGGSIPLLAAGDDDASGKKLLVVVALRSRLPAGLSALIGDSGLADKAVVRLVRPDSQPTLVVTSDNPDLLVKAGRFVGNPALLSQQSEGAKEITTATDTDTPPVAIAKITNLTASGDKLTGPGHLAQNYFIALPANRSIAEASKLSLNFRYARNLDFDRSMVTVLINDKPIGSKKLTSELADGDTLNLTIPKNMDLSGNFTVSVAFDLELLNTTCADRQSDMPWAYIDKESVLQLNTKDRTELLFNNYPYPFLRDGIYNHVGVVLPEDRGDYTYRAIGNLFNLLGQYAEGNTGEVAFLEDGASADELAGFNLIAIGSYRNNKVIRDQNGKLYFQYNGDGSGFVSNEKMSIDETYGQRLGSLQLIDSPYASGHGLLAVTGPDDEYVYLASKLIASQAEMWKVYGDAAVTDKDGHTAAYRFKLEKTDQAPVVQNILQRKDALTFTAAAVAVMVLVLVSLILMIRKHRKRRG
ncbi:cellulose biosynthesis cyclic di-GMP-binding regulatory protein BcsB [Cohnella zeiphila]|uniref:cellulose biosynthesis cyclic di-GMP-binding regulatory protein BcsB n=1 Tax=Cohnella zeiphila TaxID=2761120 RepID=UPI001EE17CD8|nr:cellulose biosynthesis cyclic di-GMP-binding regulatory protein BcsB [Cohnella zeiphila]